MQPLGEEEKSKMNRAFRLKSSKAFEYIHKNGKSYADKNLVLIVCKTKYSLKVGFSVSKKVGKAVVRNKTKRRLREGFRLLIPSLNRHFNYMLIARAAAASCDYHTLLSSMKTLLNKAGMVVDTELANKII